MSSCSGIPASSTRSGGRRARCWSTSARGPVTVNGVRIVFAGEIACGDGRLSRLAPLQYNYNDLTGAGNVWRSLRRLEDESPSLILPSLGEPVRDPAAFDEAHFGAESQGGQLEPYRLHLPEGGVAEFAGWILNPLAAAARIALVGPDGWTADAVTVTLGPRERKDIRVRITPPPEAKVRRQPVVLDLTVNGRPFGQVAEALVTIGLPRF